MRWKKIINIVGSRSKDNPSEFFLLPLLLYTNTRYSWSTYTWLKMHRRFLLCHDKGHNLSAADHVTKSHQHSAWRLPSSDSLGISTVKRTLAIKNHKRK